MPQAPIARNQTTITGPNIRPTAAGPEALGREQDDDDRRRDRHDQVRPATAATTFSPSTAESTEIAGVIMLSPKKSEAPKMPSAASASFVRRPPLMPPAADQRDQRHDAALAVVVGAHHQQHVLDA